MPPDSGKETERQVESFRAGRKPSPRHDAQVICKPCGAWNPATRDVKVLPDGYVQSVGFASSASVL